jgi:aldehyde dehydrogenase (NAD+)
MAVLADRAGIPAGVFNVIPSSDAAGVGRELCANPKVRKITFTGSTRVGRILMEQCAPTIKKLSLELGGNAPFIVFDDADLDAAVEGSHFGLYFNQGQCCCAGSRLFVHESIHDKFVERLVAKNEVRRLGNPLDPATEQGPQVDQAQFDKIMSFVEKGKSEGAQCLTGGVRFGDRGYFIQPTLFADVTDQMAIAQDEIFGPVIAVFPWEDREAVIAEANALEYGLTASVWTNDLNLAIDTANRLETGYVWINESTTHYFGMPFGGWKDSGVGREESMDELHSFLQLKSVHVKLR